MNTITPGTEHPLGKVSDEVREHRTGFVLPGIVMIAFGQTAISIHVAGLDAARRYA